MNFIEYPDPEIMMIDLANVLAGELNTALMHKDRATLAVPGGTTPGPLYDDLCGADLDWKNIDILLTDERWVSESDPRSNTRLLRERLITDRAAKASLLPLYAPADQPEDALQQLRQAIGPHLPIDVLLLGMGADMHTASLFPGADRLGEAMELHAPILLPMRALGAPEARVSLTMPVLKGAVNTHLLIVGAEKRAALKRAWDIDDPMIAPVSALLNDMTIHWAP